MKIEEVLDKHKNIALQFSGGKDSLVVLYLLKAYWDRLTVYWLDSGDVLPETRNLIDKIKAQVPNFVEIKGRQPETIAAFGWPSDVVPKSTTPFGALIEHSSIRLNDRYFCCYKSIMEPMHQRMMEDKITLIIRGQKNADNAKGPHNSGDIVGDMQVFYPIENWTDEQVMEYLKKENIDIPRYYLEGMTSAPDCMSCTAWLEHKQPAYMKKHYPEQYKELHKRLNMIRIAVEPVFNRLQEFKE
jgi:phosphoadenosine phosphosulfate reductase